MLICITFSAVFIEGVVQSPQNCEVKALSVSVPPMIFVNAMTP